jgi:hypothetical protein
MSLRCPIDPTQSVCPTLPAGKLVALLNETMKWSFLSFPFFQFFSLPIRSLPSCCWHTHASHAWYRLIMLDPHCGSMTCMTSMTSMTSMTWNHKIGCLGYLAPPMSRTTCNTSDQHPPANLLVTHPQRSDPANATSKWTVGRTQVPIWFQSCFLAT